MASNKNQHFVPRCYLKPFTVTGVSAAINLFNIDRRRFIKNAPLKHQCSRDYFYGKDLGLEKALQGTESIYCDALREIQAPGYALTDNHRAVLRHFWLLQYLRTDAAARRAVERMEDVVGEDAPDEFKLGIAETVVYAMMLFVSDRHIVDDLKVCLVKNRTRVPFITSDDPAILTNKWHHETRRSKSQTFGLQSAGALGLLPLSPRILFLAYDGDVYAAPNKGGWVEVTRVSDIEALNEHQFLNARANLFVQSDDHASLIAQHFELAAARRPTARHKVNFALPDGESERGTRYRVVSRAEAEGHESVLTHTLTVYPKPGAWPAFLRWRPKGSVFTNGSGVGFVRSSHIRPDADLPCWRERA